MSRVADSVMASRFTDKVPPLPNAVAILRRAGLHLPADHEALLASSDGVTGYGGFYRLFGLGQSVADMVAWNAPDIWKFAWPSHVLDYFCFGESAWGDQYAYLRDARTGRLEPSVYFLESMTLQPELLAPDFATFIGDELLRVCEEPYDTFTVAARNAIGDLRCDEHCVYSPSPLITGEESIAHVVKMPAVAAMICNGDLATQLAYEDHGRAIERVDPHVDAHGRSRLRVTWRE